MAWETSISQFTRHYVDKSSDVSFQFHFYCERNAGQGDQGSLAKCSTIYASPLRPNPVGIANKLGEAANWIFGRANKKDLAGELASAVYKTKAWHESFKEAVELAKKEAFKHCPSCGLWVCLDRCWNTESQLCFACAPRQTQKISFCANCGKKRPEDKLCKFCPDCGDELL